MVAFPVSFVIVKMEPIYHLATVFIERRRSCTATIKGKSRSSLPHSRLVFIRDRQQRFVLTLHYFSHVYILKRLLGCNLNRSLWSSYIDVPVPETEPWSGGWGKRGEGSKLWPPFSVTREPGSSLTGVESEGIESLLFPFCPSGTTCRGECCQCCR